MSGKKEARNKISNLIEKYDKLSPERLHSYNEADTRRDFIMPLFQSLGWDVYNDFSENEVMEEEITISGRIDFSFRLNNITQFVLEAKSIPEDLDKEKWAQQAIEYGWNKGIPWVILSDFEGLKIFNSDWKKDNPQANLNFSYKEYIERFDDLWLLSKESFETGELDKLLSKFGIKAKRESVNEKLAKDLLSWRELLTNNFSAWNLDIDQLIIGESVQRILDRLIFIRVVEDKKLEDRLLWQTYQKWVSNDHSPSNFLKVLIPVFRDFDKKYNSNLFSEHISENLVTTFETFDTIIPELYSDKEAGVKYRFDAIDADVLGNVYEQYLGYVQDREGTKSKRKKQGIYYTPTHIVDYIVQNTLGKAMEEKTLREIEDIKILDPACGSGSFLIKAFDTIKEKVKKERGRKDSFDAALQKHNILTNNIYGVDLDSQAVEIARLNLLLQALEPNHKLPMLNENIKNGNSLIDDKKFTNKPFNWQEEFPEVFAKGGFDVVIGNPPYVRHEEIKEIKEYLAGELKNVYAGTADLYVYFFEKSLEILRDGGYFGFIVSNKFTRAGYGEALRQYIQENFKITHFIDKFDSKVFADASVDPCIIIIKKEKPNKNHRINYNYGISLVPQSTLSKKGWLFADSNVVNLKDKIFKQGTLLKDLDINIRRGIVTGFNKGFLINSRTKEKLIEEDRNAVDVIKPLLRGRDISKHEIDYKNLYLIKIESGWTDKNKGNKDPEVIYKSEYSTIYNHLKEIEESTESKGKGLYERDDQGDYWWELRDCDYYEEFEKPKIIYPDISQDGGFYWDEDGYFITNTAYMLTGKVQKHWVAILNSKLMSWYYKQIASELGTGAVRYFTQFVRELPIVEEKGALENIISKREVLKTKIDSSLPDSDEWRKLKEDIAKVDEEINSEVYKLYNLTTEEIEIVEKQVNNK